MRKKLRKSHQGQRTVHKYVYELEDLFMTVGAMSKRECVDKLWYGLNTYIQKSLWKERLNPASSSWKEVLEMVEILERIEQVGNHVGAGTDIGPSNVLGNAYRPPQQDKAQRQPRRNDVSTEIPNKTNKTLYLIRGYSRLSAGARRSMVIQVYGARFASERLCKV